ncbi:MAG: RNA-binding protein [Myxococcota bacterium]
MSTPDKRAREKRKAERKREKDERRWERRERETAGVEIISAEEAAGTLPTIAEAMQDFEGGTLASPGEGAPTMPTKLFVGGLSYNTDNAGLRAAFEAHGAVVEAVVVTDRDTGRSRGFGFVTMADRKDAPGAIDKLHRSELDGRQIIVNVATERR